MKASMKMKLKAVAAAVALTLAAGQANATFTLGNDTANGNSELFLLVWSPSLQLSYTRDLGISLVSFGAGAGGPTLPGLTGTNAPVAGTYAFGATPTVAAGNVNAAGYGLTFSADAVLNGSGLLGATDTTWMVGAVDTTPSIGNNNTRSLTTASGPITAPNNANANSMAGAGNSYLANVNSTGTHQSSGPTGNGSSLNTPADASAYGEFLANNWNSRLPSNNATGLVGQTLQFFMVTASSNAGLAPSSVYQYGDAAGASTWQLNADGTLGYAAAAVPLPAAVWLFGSGLLGLVGIARRRKLGELAA